MLTKSRLQRLGEDLRLLDCLSVYVSVHCFWLRGAAMISLTSSARPNQMDVVGFHGNVVQPVARC